MKKLAVLVLALALLLPTFGFAEEVVSFSDPVFEQKFREQIGRPEGELYASDCEGVTELYFANVLFPDEERLAVRDEDKIHSLADVDKFPNLIFIDYGNNAVSDITPLSQLSHLEMIEGPANYVTNIGPIAGLTNLYHAVFWENQISDISALRYLVNLQTLSLFNNQVTDISALADKDQLTILELNGNPIADFSPVLPILGQLEYIDFIDKLKDDEIANIQQAQPPEEPEPEPEQMDDGIDASGVPDTPLVFDDPMFEKALRDAMDIHDRPITQKDAYLVQEIHIHNDKSEGSMFSDISPIQYFVNLEQLKFNSNLISDLSPLASLTKLKTLVVAYNQVSDITPLANLTSLCELYLEFNQISDVSALAGLTELRKLNLEENMLESVLPLKDLTKLESVKVKLVQMDPEGVSYLVQHPNLYEVSIFIAAY